MGRPRPESPPPLRQVRQLAAGEPIFLPGEAGQPWRVESGSVRLDTQRVSGAMGFASLAVAGDLIGSEAMLFGEYAYSAQALTPCRLSPWPEGLVADQGVSLMESLARAQRRAADMVALRGGMAAERVLGLIRLLAGAGNRVVLPTRQDVADITDLRLETVSRIIKGLERAGILAAAPVAGVPTGRSFAIDHRRLPA